MTWLLQNARVHQQTETCDLLLERGLIHVLPQGNEVSALNTWDLEGRVVLPGLADMHVHLDKTYSDFTNVPGTLWGAIESFRDTITTRTEQDIYDRAERALRSAVKYGVTRMRSHVNLGSESDLALFRILSALRERYRAAIELQFAGMISAQLATESPAIVDQAVEMGMDLIGGAPALEEAPDEAVKVLVDCASRLKLPIDLHVDETEDPGSRTLKTLADTMIDSAFSHKATASHCCSLAFIEPRERTVILDRVKEAGITIVSLPMCNLMLMGRDIEPKPRGITPIRDLINHGIPVCAGSDNVHDPFNPFGNYDPLSAMQLAILGGHLTDHATLNRGYELVTTNANEHFSSGGHIADGQPADLTVLEETDSVAGIVNPPQRLATFKGGKLVYRLDTSETWNL